MNFWCIVGAILLALLIWRFGVLILALLFGFVIMGILGLIGLYGLILRRIKKGFKGYD